MYETLKGHELRKDGFFVKGSNEQMHCCEKLDFMSLHLRTFADVTFATNVENSSQLAYIVLFVNL